MEFAIGALAAVGAGFFTNPVDVVKVRLQLQGELEARGSYTKIYKNTLHAAYLIGKHEGVLALQAGLVPALAFQVVLNGIRLGAYKSAQRYELIVDERGNTDVLRTALVSGTAGCVGAVLGSPLYLVIVHSIAFESLYFSDYNTSNQFSSLFLSNSYKIIHLHAPVRIGGTSKIFKTASIRLRKIRRIRIRLFATKLPCFE